MQPLPQTQPTAAPTGAGLMPQQPSMAMPQMPHMPQQQPQQPAMPQQPTVAASDGTAIDASAAALAKAIRQRESAGNYQVYGDNKTSYGAYQWNNGHDQLKPGQIPVNFQNAAKQFGLDPNDFSPVNQDKVAYHQVVAMKQRGFTPAQVAASWNAGEGYKDTWQDHIGDTVIAGKKIHYDTRAYVNEVIGNYQKYAEEYQSGQPSQPDMQGGSMQPAAQHPSLFGNLAQDFSKRGQNMADASARQGAGQQGILSTGLQDVGQVAGGIGDVFGEALGAIDRAITGGKVTSFLQHSIEGLASTAPGQAIVQGYQGFKGAHPVAAANVEAVANIGSLLPIGRGASLAKEAIGEGAAKAVGSDAVQALAKGAAQDVRGNLTDLFTRTKPLANAYDYMKTRGFDPEGVLLERKLATKIPIEDGKVHLPEESPVRTALHTEIASDSKLLDKALSKHLQTITADDLKAQADNQIARDPAFRQQGRVPEMQARAASVIDNYVKQEGKAKFTLTDVQSMKKGQASLSSMFRKSLDFGKADEHSALASALRHVIEDNAPDVSVRKLNRKIGELEETSNFLDKLNGTAVKGGRLGPYAGRILGATIGSQGHIPVISPIIGALIGDAVVKGLQKSSISGPINRLLMKVAHVAPDNAIVKDTITFVEAVERGEKIMPTDDVAEFLAHLTAKSDIPLLPAPVQKEFRSIIESGPTMNMPEHSQSTVDAMERQNPSIKTPTTDPHIIDKKIQQVQEMPQEYTPDNQLPVIDAGPKSSSRKQPQK